MATKAPLVYPDAVLFLDVLQAKDEPMWRASLKVLEAAERGDVRFVASRLLAAEVGRFRGDASQEAVDELVLRYLDSVNTRWVEVDLIAARDARRLSWEHGIKSGADSVHLATAVRAGADYFMSRDNAFPYGAQIGPTIVTKPIVVWTPTLDDELTDEIAAPTTGQPAPPSA